MEDKSMYTDKEKNFSIIKTIFNFVFWIAIIGLAVIWIIEFIMVRTENDPWFCIEQKEYEYEDGKVTECIGLGYKVYNYERDSITAREFGPFFIEMREE